MASKEVKSAVKAHLRERKVKLWEPPHTDADGKSTVSPELLKSIADTLSLDPADVGTAVEALRSSAVKKAQKRNSSTLAAPVAQPEGAPLAPTQPPAQPDSSEDAPQPSVPEEPAESNPEAVEPQGTSTTAVPATTIPESAPVPETQPDATTPNPPADTPIQPAPTVAVDESAAAVSALASGGSDDVVASPAVSGQSEEPQETGETGPETGASDEPFDPFNESVTLPPREEHNVRHDRTTLVKTQTEQDDLDLADADAVLAHKMQIVTSSSSPKIQRKHRKLTNMFKSRRRKEEEVEQMIGIDNDAFFLGQKAAEAMSFKPKHPDEEPAYFDELTEEQQAAYEKRVSVMLEGDTGLFDPFADVQEAATHDDNGSDDGSDDDDAGVTAAAALAAGSPDKADAAPAPLAATDEFGDEADDFLAELPPSKFTPAATGGWKRSLSGKHLVAAEPEPEAASSTDHDTLELDGATEGESSTDSSRSRKLLSGFKSFKNKLRGSKHRSDKAESNLLPPAAPVVQPQMDFVASEMRMTDAQRIAVMSMVRDGKLSIEAAIRKVLTVEELLEETEAPSNSHSHQGGNAKEVRIADDARKAIMDQVKTGHLSVEEAIQMILDAEDEIAIAQGLKRRTSTMRQKVTQSMVFNDDDLSYMASQTTGTLSSATANRPRPQHRKPNRDTLRKSMLAPMDVFSQTATVLGTDSSATTPADTGTASEASSTAASRTSSGPAADETGEDQPVKPERKRRKNKTKAAKTALPEVEVTFKAPEFKASELHLTPEQQLKVMTLVKEGTLTMDQAMAKVMEVEADAQRHEAGPQVDEEGFTVVEDAAEAAPDAFEAAFAPEDDDSDFDDSTQASPVAKAKFRLRINSRPVMDAADPFAGAAVSQGSGDADGLDASRERLDTSVVREAFDEEDAFVMKAAQSHENLTVGLAVASAGPVDPFAMTAENNSAEAVTTAPVEVVEGSSEQASAPSVAEQTDVASTPATDVEASAAPSKPAPPPVKRRRSSGTVVDKPTADKLTADKPTADKPAKPKPAPPPVRKRSSTEGAKVLAPKPAPAPAPKPRTTRASTVAAGDKPGRKPPPVTKPKPLSATPSTESLSADLRAPTEMSAAASPTSSKAAPPKPQPKPAAQTTQTTAPELANPEPTPAEPKPTPTEPEPELEPVAPKRSLKDRLRVASSLPDDPPPASKPKAAAPPAAARSKIYQALNAQPLWAESEADKAKREARNLVVGVGSGASQRGAAAILAEAEDDLEGLADLDAADDRLEALREQARNKMADFDAVMTGGSAAPEPQVQLRKKKKPVVAPKAKADFNPFADPAPAIPGTGDDGSNRNSRLSTASSDFNDDDFMAELNRRRQQRAEEEARRAEELRKQHAIRESKEQAERQKVIDEVNAQKRLEEEKERRRKSVLYHETLETAQDMTFDFKFGE
eukprot:m.220034 g.220034  ORF g.220034 m.220034 type:complete len:1428 (+) comp17239_c0_seq4:206-4489(+)